MTDQPIPCGPLPDHRDELHARALAANRHELVNCREVVVLRRRLANAQAQLEHDAKRDRPSLLDIVLVVMLVVLSYCLGAM